MEDCLRLQLNGRVINNYSNIVITLTGLETIPCFRNVNYNDALEIASLIINQILNAIASS